MPNIYIRIGKTFKRPDRTSHYAADSSDESIKQAIDEAFAIYHKEREASISDVEIWLKVLGRTDWMEGREIARYVRCLSTPPQSLGGDE